ncbi:MAG TPA: polyprenyl synthetase family protein [Candidatus Saccharimonadales bacterium]
MSVSPLESLRSYRQPLEQSVESVLNDFLSELPDYSEDVRWAFDTLKEYSLRPSKRVRGTLAAALYDEVTGQEKSLTGLRLGAAIEFVQNHLLIVDDVMDRSLTRRGRPTVHEVYKADFNYEDEHQSNMMAILVGMLAQYVTNHALTTLDADAESRLRVLSVLQRHIAITDMGQVDDLSRSITRPPVSEEDLLRKYRQKSSYYSFVDPIETALLLAGKDEVIAQRDAEAFGIPAGVTFQLRDDYLGIFGDTSATGKPNLDDIQEGKYTLMIHFALEKADADQKSKIHKILGNAESNEADLEVIQKILNETGASKRAMAEAARYAAEAKASLERVSSWSPEFSRRLEALVDFSMERTA